MAYCCDLPHGPKLYLDNQADQTIVVLLMMQPGQQQQSSHSLTTGIWQVPPEIFAVGNMVLVKLVTSIGEFVIQVQGMAVQSGLQSGASASTGGTPIAVMPIDTMPNSTGFSSQSAQSSAQSSTQPMQPMTLMQPMAPMQPMQTGNMQMNLKPMQMQMGNMAMNMGAETAASTVKLSSPNVSSGTAKFCSQCGNPLKPGDRFCSGCGHALT